MFTYSNIMRALKAGGVPDYWYAQFVVNDANAQTIGLAGRGVTVVSAGDVAYPVYLNTYNDAAQTAGTATHWYDLNANSNDGVGTAHGTGTDITYSNGGAVFNGETSKILLPISIYAAQWRTLEIVFELNGPDCLLFNMSSAGEGNVFDIRITGTGQIIYRVYTNELNQARGSVIDINKKYYAVLTYNSTTGEILGYLNGIQVARAIAVTSGNHATGIAATIGMYLPLDDSVVDGVIYDVKLNSSVVSPAQIKANALAIGLYGEQIANQDNVKVWHDKIAGDIYSKLTRYNYDDASQTAGTATHWYELNTDSNDSVGTAHGTNTDITYSNGGAVFNGTTSKITLPSSVYTAQWRTLEIVFELNDVLNSILFNIRNAASSTLFDIRIFDNGDISYRVFTNALYTASAATKIVANKKYYAVLTYNSTTGEILGYLDGELIAQATAAAAGDHGTGAAAAIGYFIYYNDAFVNGTIYDLKLHSTTLTPAQIKANALAIGLYDGPIETEYTGITADLKPASYDPADTTLDTTSTIATNPDANDWQPYGA